MGSYDAFEAPFVSVEGTPTVDRALVLSEATQLVDRLRVSLAAGRVDREWSGVVTIVSSLLALLKADAERVQALEADAQLLADIRQEYQDAYSKQACDDCEECSSLVMCSFHSCLSVVFRGCPTKVACDRFRAEKAEIKVTSLTREVATLGHDLDDAMTAARKAEAEVTRLTAQWKALKANLSARPQAEVFCENILDDMAELEAQR